MLHCEMFRATCPATMSPKHCETIHSVKEPLVCRVVVSRLLLNEELASSNPPWDTSTRQKNLTHAQPNRLSLSRNVTVISGKILFAHIYRLT